MKCQVCDDENMAVQWTDTHGVAQCVRCGCPYQIYHYDEKGNRENRPEELLILTDYVPLVRRYWQESHRPMVGGFSLGFGRYEVAKPGDAEAFNAWWTLNCPDPEPSTTAS